jgi:hypothetical protein
VDATKAAALAAAAAKKPTLNKDGTPVITVSDRDARAERKAAAKLAREAGEEIKIPIVELQTPLTGNTTANCTPNVRHSLHII